MLHNTITILVGGYDTVTHLSSWLWGHCCLPGGRGEGSLESSVVLVRMENREGWLHKLACCTKVIFALIDPTIFASGMGPLDGWLEGKVALGLKKFPYPFPCRGDMLCHQIDPGLIHCTPLPTVKRISGMPTSAELSHLRYLHSSWKFGR